MDMVASTMDREDVTAMIIQAKKNGALTWEGIAEMIGMSPVWTHSAAMGMNAMPAEKADALVAALALPS
ncbi:MAG: cyanate hydratase, partial [Pseudomonadota bacterium]